MAIEIMDDENPFLITLEDHKFEEKIKKTITDMADFASTLLVMDKDSYNSLTSVYRKARDWKKTIDDKRKSLVEPFRSKITIINDRAHELTDPLDNIISIANAKTVQYIAMLEQKKAIEDQRLLKKACLFDDEDSPPTAVYIAPMETSIKGEGAKAVTKSDKRFKVIDIDLVPKKYLTIDEKLVKQDLKLGILQIPGIEIYEEQTTKLRIR